MRGPQPCDTFKVTILQAFMDHACHKCGNSTEDGKAFCSQCGAPQIRVATGELSGFTQGEDSSLSSRAETQIPILLKAPNPPGGIAWPAAIRACGIAAIVCIAVVSLRLIPLLLALLGAGILAVILYHRRNPIPRMTARSGAQLGAATGLISAGISAVFSLPVILVLQSGGQIRQDLLDRLQQFASRSNDPQVQATLDLLKTPAGVTKLVLAIVGLLFLSIAMGGIAGALAGFLLGRRKGR
jgi:RNA polymerase subunit RPABC4/transcription elongation factor Spt4